MELAEKQIQGLQRLLSLLDPDTLTKEEFVKSFDQVVKLVKQIEQRNMEEVSMMRDMHEKLSEHLRNTTDTNLQEVKRQITEYCMSEMMRMHEKHEEKMGEMDMKMSEVRDGEDADEDEIVEKVMERVQSPILDKIEKSIPQIGTEIRNALELLQGEERLSMDAINGLQEALDELKQRNTGTVLTGGNRAFEQLLDVNAANKTNGSFPIWSDTLGQWVMGTSSSTGTAVDGETPTDSGDGVNFTIANTPIAGTFKLYRGGARQKSTVDYTLTGTALVLSVALASGEVLICDYSYL